MHLRALTWNMSYKSLQTLTSLVLPPLPLTFNSPSATVAWFQIVDNASSSPSPGLQLPCPLSRLLLLSSHLYLLPHTTLGLPVAGSPSTQHFHFIHFSLELVPRRIVAEVQLPCSTLNLAVGTVHLGPALCTIPGMLPMNWHEAVV